MIALDIAIIIILIAVGLFLIILEIFFLPGTSIAGFASLIFFGGGIYYAFEQFGQTGGYITLIFSCLSCVVSIIWFIRSKSLDRISLQTDIDSKVTNDIPQEIKLGNIGVTLSRLNPMGKVLINGKTVEAKSPEGFIDEERPIEVVKVQHTVVIVRELEK